MIFVLSFASSQVFLYKHVMVYFANRVRCYGGFFLFSLEYKIVENFGDETIALEIISYNFQREKLVIQVFFIFKIFLLLKKDHNNFNTAIP